MEQLRESHGDMLSAVTLHRSQSNLLEVSLGRDKKLFVNAQDGSNFGEGNAGVRACFSTIKNIHRWLAAPAKMRPWGKYVTGAANVAFLFIIVSGLYLWWPRRINGVFNRTSRSSGKGSIAAQTFKLHNIVGFWCSIPLLIIVISGMVISYGWAATLVYKMFGEKPPARSSAAGSSRESSVRSPRESAVRPDSRPGVSGESNSRELDDRVSSNSAPLTAAQASKLSRVDEQIEFATQRNPDWQTLTFQNLLSDDRDVVIAVDTGTGGQPQFKSEMRFPDGPAQAATVEPFSAKSAGSRARSFLRFAHTGEVFGLWGQALAGIVSLAGSVLVVTGGMLFRKRWIQLKTARSKST